MKRIKLFLTVVLLSLSQISFGQNIKIAGTVMDSADGYPLEGAAVQVKGSVSKGVAVDAVGNYTIYAKPNDVLVFTYLNYKTLEIPVNGRKKIDVKMETSSEQLETTIVVGYGSARKISSVVGAATTVSAKTFQNSPVASAGDALQGQVAGLQVFTSSGEPSATVSMRLRGVSSINAGVTPLYILDGSPVSSSIFTTLNPDDIENITVLKDASSTAIYGSRAANGVVYITTKRGTSETPTVKISAQYGVSNVANLGKDMMNSRQWFTFREMVEPSLKTNSDWLALKEFRLSNNIHTNWRKWIMREDSPTYSANMSVSGRTNKTDYYISAGTFYQGGIIDESNLKRQSIRSNINTKLTSWLKLGVKLNLTYETRVTNGYISKEHPNRPYNPINIALWTVPYATPYEILTDDDGNFIGYGDEVHKIDELGMYNIKYLYTLQPRKTSYVRLNGNTYQEITPIKGLTIRAAQAIEGFDYRRTAKNYPGEENLLTRETHEYFTRSYRLTSTNTAEYKFRVLENHHFDALFGQEAIKYQYEGFSASSEEQSDDRLMNVSQGTNYLQPEYDYSATMYSSIFSRLSYDYKAKYFLDLTWRRDGSSLFGKNKRYANFWSAGAMWNIKKESFMNDFDWVNNLQLKVSYGTTGNSSISNYLSYGTIGTSSVYNGNSTWALSGVQNDDLTWETLKTFNIAINTHLFNSLDLDLEFYNKTTSDMLLEVPYSYSTGFASGWGNVGKMRNRGIDLTIGYDILNNDNFYFNVTGNFNYNKNEILDLYEGRDSYTVANTGMRYEVGHDVGEYYSVRYAGVDPATGKQLWLDKNGNITGNYSDDDSVMTGKSMYAPWSAGLQLNFSWKNLSLNAMFSGVFGKWLLNNQRYFIENSNFSSNTNQVVGMLNMWTTPGQKTEIPKAGETLQFDTHLIENASFVRLKDLQLSYSLSKKILKKTNILSGVRFYAKGRNLLTFTKYKGFDPEVDDNIALSNYPNTKQYIFGVELTF